MSRLSLVHVGFILAFTFGLVQMACLFSLETHLLLHRSCSEAGTPGGGTGLVLSRSGSGGNIACGAYDSLTTATALPNIDTDMELLGVPQTIDPAHATAILDRLDRARSYMQQTVSMNKKYEKVRNTCKLTYANCTQDAALGRCENNETMGKMSYQCAPVCETCELVDYNVRCPMNEFSDDENQNSNSNHNTLHAGDLDRTFQDIVDNPRFQNTFGLQVLSRPSYAAGDTAATANYQIGGPWVVLFDNLLTDPEADRLIEMGGIQGYKQSGVTDEGHKRADGTAVPSRDSGRTSTNAWCVDDCPKDPTVERATVRIAEITGIPVANYEYLQILRYTAGQFFNLHNDYIVEQKSRQPGVRILTFYVYLSDVEEGGGTQFPSLNLTVTPKKGRAILWPSVLTTDPNSKDIRTNHHALPVISGVKYGFNAWIHQRDFRGPHRKGCH
jgi:prolyl 4-hydroxylase